MSPLPSTVNKQIQNIPETVLAGYVVWSPSLCSIISPSMHWINKCLFGLSSFHRLQRDHEAFHSISQLSVLSFFPLNRVRMGLFRPFRLVWSLHVGQRCHLHPTNTYWETAVTASGQTRATASQISASAWTMPALKEGFYFTHRRVSGNTRSHWLPVCWRLNTFMLIWGLHLCMQTLYVYVDALSVYMTVSVTYMLHADRRIIQMYNSVSCEEHLTALQNPEYVMLSSDHVCCWEEWAAALQSDQMHHFKKKAEKPHRHTLKEESESHIQTRRSGATLHTPDRNKTPRNTPKHTRHCILSTQRSL